MRIQQNSHKEMATTNAECTVVILFSAQQKMPIRNMLYLQYRICHVIDKM